jgi:hypothetical protein
MTFFNCIAFLTENSETQKFFLAFQKNFNRSTTTTQSNAISKKTMEIVLTKIKNGNGDMLINFFVGIGKRNQDK